MNFVYNVLEDYGTVGFIWDTREVVDRSIELEFLPYLNLHGRFPCCSRAYKRFLPQNENIATYSRSRSLCFHTLFHISHKYTSYEITVIQIAP